VNPGFRVDKIVTMDVSLPWVEDPKAKAGQGIFYSNLIDRLKQIPGVRKVGAVSNLPMEGGLPDGMFFLMTQNEIPKTDDGFAPLLQQKERLGNADFGVATDGYFQVLGIPLIRGRIFDEHDGPDEYHDIDEHDDGLEHDDDLGARRYDHLHDERRGNDDHGGRVGHDDHRGEALRITSL